MLALLFGAYTYREHRGEYPRAIRVVGWAFKAERFQATLDAIHRWDRAPFRCADYRFLAEGQLNEPALSSAARTEAGYVTALKAGLEAYYATPHVREILRARDPWHVRNRVHERYAPLPFSAAPDTGPHTDGTRETEL